MINVINKTDASKYIFLPVVAYRINSGWGSVTDGAGFYWTSSLHISSNVDAFEIHMNKNNPETAGIGNSGRFAGDLVRAVRNIAED